MVLLAAVIYFFEARKRQPLAWDEKLYRQLVKQIARWDVGYSLSDGPLTLQAKVARLGPKVSEKLLGILEPLILVRFGGQEISKDMQTTLRRRLKALRKLSIKPPRH